MSLMVAAGLWGLLAASGVSIGATVAVMFHGRISHRIISAVMGFGGGVLIAVLSADLIETAFEDGGAAATGTGFLLGALIFSTINWKLAQYGAKHRNRCGGCVKQPEEAHRPGSGLSIALGALLDGIPESIVIGLSVAEGGKIGIALIAGFFLANVPQGLSSASGMKTADRSLRYIFSVWIGITLISGMAAAIGAVTLGSAPPEIRAAILAFAAGSVLAMLAESMIPEAFEDAQPFIGLITVFGFLAAFLLVQI